MQVAFTEEIIHTQYCIENKGLDAHFPKYKLEIEVDEYNHEGRNFEYEQSRKFMIESHGINFIRTNPDVADFDMNKLINQIYPQIIKSTKKSLIGDLLKRFGNTQSKTKPIKIGKQPGTTYSLGFKDSTQNF